MLLRTVENHIENTIIIEKSRFICELFHVESEQEAKSVLKQTRENHPKAVHHCYAYIIKNEYQNIENQSDDGEPSKTAGIPMLDILRYENLVNTMAIVTRYFGGTLLGTGGLIRAYSGSVKKAVDLAKIKQAKLLQGYRLEASYSQHQMIEYELKKFDAVIKNIEYEQEVIITFYTDDETLLNYLIEKTNNSVKITKLDRVYM